MTLYGLYGFTHGWARVLTVMSPEGARAVAQHIHAGDDVITTADDGRLAQFQEKRRGALDRLVEHYGIVVLSKTEWDAKKAELGEAIW